MTRRRPAWTHVAACTIGLVAAVGCAGADDSASTTAAGTDPASATTAPPAATTIAAPTTTSTTTTTSTATSTSTTSTTTTVPATALRLDHVQVLGSHNSYHLAPTPDLFAGIAALSAELAESIEYSHRSLTEQLDTFGIRQFEIDVMADPVGGLYASRAANPVVGLDAASGEAALDAPGFKVLHTQDFDYGTTCLTLQACLEEIETWSSANPQHMPIMIMIEIKSLSVPEAAAEEGHELTVDLPWAQPVATTAEILVDLDAEIRAVFDPDRLIEPDDVRGDAATLEAAVLDSGWPTIEESRGQVLFTMTDGGDVRDLYVADAPNLEGRPIFTNGTPGNPDAAFVRFDDPLDPALDDAARAGYLVRTRTDSPTEDARTDNTARRDAALASGAHYLSTDYYAPSELFDSPYVVELPDGAIVRCNPVTAPPDCQSALLAAPSP